MMQNEEKDVDLLWWVQYSYKRDHALHSGRSIPQANTFFYAPTREEVCQKVALWVHDVKQDSIIVESIELAPYGFNSQSRYLPPTLLREQVAPPEK